MPLSADLLGVLIVDDDAAFLKTTGDALRLHGFEPYAAQTGRRAMEIAARRPPAIAVIDLGLPDMDGIDLLTELHAEHAATEVILLAGNASVTSAVRALREQTFDYLLKPVSPDQLVATLERAAERWRRRQAEAALAASEERFRSLIENATDPVAILGASGTIRYASPAYQAALGLSPESLVGMDLFDLTHPDDRSTLDAALRLLLEAHGKTTPVTLRLRSSDGVWRTLAGRGKNLLDDTAIRGIVLNSRDVTEQLALEAQLRQAQKVEAIGQLAGGVAHDLNNMLTAILSFSQLAERSLPPDHEARDDMQQVVLAAQRAAALTRQLLTFSRRQVLQPRPIDLSAVVSGIQPMLRRLIDVKIDCHTKLETSPRSVMADPTQIEQVLLNLVLNARDAMPEGGTIVIETRQVDIDEKYVAQHFEAQCGPHVLLSVSDTGTGMDAEVQARVFEPFFTTKPAGRGTGLGLSTVYSIVRQSGGSLRLHSEKGRGTTFEVLLPCIAEDISAVRDDRLDPTTDDARTLSILVVDDDDAVRRAAARTLQQAGHTVLTAVNGREALAMAGDPGLTVDLVISDLVMPDLSGWDLGAELTVRKPGTRLLFMSGYTTEETGRGMPLIGDGFLQKPFTPDSLIEHVRLAMRTR